MHLILYSKPGCHLCEGLLEKLEQVTTPQIEQVEVRDITTQEEWFQHYQYEIPVLCYKMPDGTEVTLPRLSPRAPVSRLADLLAKALQ
ncbi:MAG: glutaredoxin family protein [Prochlorotrichaceae cyanobacterium]